MRLGISLSTNVSAFSRAPERNVRINISLSSDFGAFSTARQNLAGTIWHLRTVHSLASFLILSISCVAFSKGKERRFGEGLLGDNSNRTAARGLGGLACDQRCNTSSPSGSFGGRACALCQGIKYAGNLQKKRRQGFVLDPLDILSFVLPKTMSGDREDVQKTGAYDLASSYGALSCFIPIFDILRCLFKRKREKVWRETPL